MSKEQEIPVGTYRIAPNWIEFEALTKRVQDAEEKALFQDALIQKISDELVDLQTAFLRLIDVVEGRAEKIEQMHGGQLIVPPGGFRV